MPTQRSSWTCSACALAWVLRATGLDPWASEDKCINQIGYPENVNATYGLMDGSGTQLRRVLAEYGQASSQAWLTFETVYAIAGETTGLMSGGNWYHWVAIRGHDGGNIWVANSAPGYRGVWESLSREEFQRLGPFSVVWLEA